MNSDQTGHANVDNPIDDVQAAAGALLSKNYELAVEIAERLVADTPGDPLGYVLLAATAELNNERGRAIEMLLRAHELDPDTKEYALALATLYTYVGKLADGLFYFKLSDVLSSSQIAQQVIPRHMLDYGRALSNVEGTRHYIEAMRAYNVTDYERCVDECMRELRHNQHHERASELLGLALIKTGRPGRAISAFQTAIHLNPANAGAYAGLGEALVALGSFTDAAACFERALGMEPENAEIVCRAQMGLTRFPGASVQSVVLPALKWREAMGGELDQVRTAENYSRRRPLRVGVVSDAFFASAFQPYFTYFLENHNWNEVEIRFYSLGKLVDATTSRIQNTGKMWRELSDIDQFTLAETLRREELDVMLDLCFEPETHAMEMLAAGVAPVQVSWFGRPEAGGLPGITHVLSDDWTKMADERALAEGQSCLSAEYGYLARDAYLAYDEILPSPVGAAAFLMFGMRADPGCITAQDALAVSDVLREVPGARLLLGLSTRLDEETRNRLVGLFALGGVVDRMIFQELPGNHGVRGVREAVEMDFFRDVDVFLAPSSNVHFDDVALALWMGAPAVAMCGSTRRTRFSASVLAQAGRQEWIVDDGRSLVNVCRNLASDTQRLAELRKTLRDEVSSSNLFSTRKVALGLWRAISALCEE